MEQETKTERKEYKHTPTTKKRLEWIGKQLGMNSSAVIDLCINEKYIAMQGKQKEQPQAE